MPPPSASGQGLQRHGGGGGGHLIKRSGQGSPAELGGVGEGVREGRCTPVGLEGTALNQRGLFSSLKSSWNSLGLALDLLRPYQFFLVSYFSTLEWGCLSYACPTVVF